MIRGMIIKSILRNLGFMRFKYRFNQYVSSPVSGLHTFDTLEVNKQNIVKINDIPIPKRPDRFDSYRNDFKLAYLVFTRQCDAFKWPEDDPKINPLLD